MSAVKRLITLLYKPLTQMDEQDIFYYLDWYEHRNEKDTGKRTCRRQSIMKGVFFRRSSLGCGRKK